MAILTTTPTQHSLLTQLKPTQLAPRTRLKLKLLPTQHNLPTTPTRQLKTMILLKQPTTLAQQSQQAQLKIPSQQVRSQSLRAWATTLTSVVIPLIWVVPAHKMPTLSTSALQLKISPKKKLNPRPSPRKRKRKRQQRLRMKKNWSPLKSPR